MNRFIRTTIIGTWLCMAGGLVILPAQTDTFPPAVYSLLPGWLFQEFPDLSGSVRMLGISDPGLPFDVARQQAFLRGVALSSMATTATGSYLSDLFFREEGEEGQSKYEEIFSVSTSFYIDPRRVTVLEESALKSGEVVLLMDVPVEKDSLSHDETLDTELFLYISEVSIPKGNQLTRKYAFSLNLDWDGQSFLMDDFSFFRMNRKASGIRTKTSRSQVCFDSLEYYYGRIPENDTGRVFPVEGDTARVTANGQWVLNSARCVNGLWIAFLSQILDQASCFLKQTADNTARVSDQTKTLRMDLSREMEVVPLRWRVHRFTVDGQEASVRVTFNAIDSF